jgi:hypothetical protein
MLLGNVPAETVQRVLEPLLADFYEVMLRLPSNLQTDFENILRIYPDVGERFGLRPKPPIMESLQRLARRLPGAEPDERAEKLEFDIAAEAQQGLETAKKSFFTEGQGFFVTDRGNPVYLEFICSEGNDFVTFGYKPSIFEIEIYICGSYTSTLSPSRPERNIPVAGFLEILMKCVQGVDIKIIEPAI